MLATLALGWAVGTGSTAVDAWFAEHLRAAVGTNPRWLLIFTSGWLPGAVLLACLVVTLRRRHWQFSAAVVGFPVAAALINAGLKRLFGRRNGPYLEYPSGHTTLLVVALGLLVVVAGWRLWALVTATALSLLGMLGLIACGYHYLTDTIGAALLGSALVCWAALLADRPVRLPAVATLTLACATGFGTSAVSWAAPAETGLVDVRTVVPNAIIDLRYATANNFLGTPLYPPNARCLVHESLAPGLAVAADLLRPRQLVLVFWDCYRPHQAQQRMFDAVPDPTFVARPGPFARSHVAGRSVDVTMAGADRRLVDMGTDFDDFSPRASAFATDGISEAAAANRALLRNAMSTGGLAAYASEWWHFDGPGAGVDRPLLDAPVS